MDDTPCTGEPAQSAHAIVIVGPWEPMAFCDVLRATIYQTPIVAVDFYACFDTEEGAV